MQNDPLILQLTKFNIDKYRVALILSYVILIITRSFFLIRNDGKRVGDSIDIKWSLPSTRSCDDRSIVDAKFLRFLFAVPYSPDE